METLTVHEVQTHLFSIVEAIEKQGKKFLISKDGKPVADLVPHESKKQEDVASLVQAGIATPPSEKIHKASMPKVTARGKMLSEITAEDRR
ncbi:MAG: hypothetical protein GY749_37150 [Desulfobacteraceae bacterium]|nr:hypothetical protein [Desulfobacteraceae bacterium]